MHVTHDPAAAPAAEISFDQFLAVDIRAGIGTRKSSAQITQNYEASALIGRQVAAVINFPPRQIGKFMSEVLTLGFPDEEGNVVLFKPDKTVPNGGRLF